MVDCIVKFFIVLTVKGKMKILQSTIKNIHFLQFILKKETNWNESVSSWFVPLVETFAIKLVFTWQLGSSISQQTVNKCETFVKNLIKNDQHTATLLQGN